MSIVAEELTWEVEMMISVERLKKPNESGILSS